MGDTYDADFGYDDGCGETPLMKACRAGNYEGAKVLIDNGADVNASSRYSGTALEEARERGLKKIEQVLLEY